MIQKPEVLLLLFLRVPYSNYSGMVGKYLTALHCAGAASRGVLTGFEDAEECEAPRLSLNINKYIYIYIYMFMYILYVLWLATI